MKNRIWLGSAVFACILATLAAGNPPPPRLAIPVDPVDANVPLPPAIGLCGRAALDDPPPATLAVVVVPGPMNGTRISYEIWNYAAGSISAVNIDGFDALAGQGLLFSRVTAAHASDVGSLRVDYPQSGVAGKGSIILGFTSFGEGRCAAVDAEAGTWGDPGFRGRVMDVVGARIQVVFEGGQRGNGEVVLCGSNGRFARGVPCHPGDAVALISGSQTMQVRLSQ